LPQYIRAFVPGGTFFFSVRLLEGRRRLLTEIRTGIDNREWAQMITFEVQGWDNAKGGMRFAFPPYGRKLYLSPGSADRAKISISNHFGGFCQGG